MFTNHLQDIGDLESQVHLVSPQCSTHSFNFYHQRFHPQDESCQFTIGCPTCRGSSPSATKTAPSCVWFAFPSKISSIENNRNPKSTRFGAPNDSVALKKQLGSTTKSITPQLLRGKPGMHRPASNSGFSKAGHVKKLPELMACLERHNLSVSHLAHLLSKISKMSKTQT